MLAAEPTTEGGEQMHPLFICLYDLVVQWRVRISDSIYIGPTHSLVAAVMTNVGSRNVDNVGYRPCELIPSS